MLEETRTYRLRINRRCNALFWYPKLQPHTENNALLFLDYQTWCQIMNEDDQVWICGFLIHNLAREYLYLYVMFICQISSMLCCQTVNQTPYADSKSPIWQENISTYPYFPHTILHVSSYNILSFGKRTIPKKAQYTLHNFDNKPPLWNINSNNFLLFFLVKYALVHFASDLHWRDPTLRSLCQSVRPAACGPGPLMIHGPPQNIEPQPYFC